MNLLESRFSHSESVSKNVLFTIILIIKCSIIKELNLIFLHNNILKITFKNIRQHEQIISLEFTVMLLAQQYNVTKMKTNQNFECFYPSAGRLFNTVTAPQVIATLKTLETCCFIYGILEKYLSLDGVSLN